MSSPVRLLIYNVELDPNFRNLPSDGFEFLGDTILYYSRVTHGHGGRHVSDHIHEHCSAGAHRAEVVDAQQREWAGNLMRMGVGVRIFGGRFYGGG